MTSVPLSRANKQTIKDIFAPFIQSEADILGHEDIQDFLRDHPAVVQQQYKLWLASAEVLRLIFNAPIIGRSSFKLEEVTAFAPKYVPTSCHQEAVTRLNSAGSIIIIGEPGIGKSTLAEQLVLQLALDGFELCFVENDVTEAEAAWVNDRKQVFYFDDFLGRNYLEAIDRNHDSQVLAFMRRVGKDKSKRFILTSRTTIMQQGKRLSELFRAGNIDQREYEVKVTDLSPLEKAWILYNHIWFGNLDAAFVEQLYIDKRYKAVIAHRNFNPRLIAFLTDNHKIAGVAHEKYWDYVLATLENPQDIWRGVFENQLDQMGRLLVALVVFHGGQISERELRACSERARLDHVPVPAAAEWSLEFELSYQMSVGAVINRNLDRHGSEARVGLFNPSVGDFVLRRFGGDTASLESFFSLLRDYRSLAHFQALRKSGIVTEIVFVAVVRNLAARFWREPLLTPEFSSDLASFIINNEGLRLPLRPELVALSAQFFAISDASTRPEALSDFAVFTLVEGLIPSDDERWLDFVHMVIEQTTDDSELIELSNLVNALEEPLLSSASTELAEHVISCWKDKISEEVGYHGVAADYTDDDEYSDDSYDKAKEELTKFVSNALGEYAINFDCADIDAIVDEFDLREHLRNNRRTYREYEGGGGGYSGGGISGSEQDQIDDLFQRDR
ncbi:MAG: hypothetical protein H7Y06_09625 [Opitutaceae bacterium]|nr:hypothetical protein [Opitutaceae bacterium]